MKIIHVIQELELGGLPTYVFDLCRGLTERGHDSVIMHSSESIPSIYNENNVPFERIPGLQVWKSSSDTISIAKLRGILSYYNPDVIYIHLLSNLSILAFIIKSGIPVIRMFHEYSSLCLRKSREYLPGKRCKRALGWGCFFWGCIFGNPRPGSFLPRYSSLRVKLKELALYRKVNLSVVASKYMASVLIKNDFQKNKIAIIPYFTNINKEFIYSQTSIQSETVLFKASFQRTLLFSGQVIKPKGLQLLVSALPLIDPKYHLVVVGDGDYMGVIKELANKLNLKDRIKFKGWVRHEEIYMTYLEADIVIVPSIWDEPFGLVGIEAMICGKPVISFHVGGVSEWLYHELNGLIVENQSPQGIAAAINHLLSDDIKMQNMGREARKIAKETFCIEKHLDNLIHEMSRLCYANPS
jgi:glycosyltransferase involved in cell wall biosynthesis